MKFPCTACPSRFTRKKNLNRHYAQKHLGLKNVFACFLCGRVFENYRNLKHHHEGAHKASSYFEIREQAFRKSAVSYRYIFDSSFVQTPNDCLDNFLKIEMKKVILHEALRKNSIKFSSIFIANMVMMGSEGECLAKASIPFRSQTFSCTSTSHKNLDRLIRYCINDHLGKIEEFINNGSNWVYDSPVALDLEITTSPPLFVGAESYKQIVKCDLSSIPNKKNVVNVPSSSNECFLYCVAWFLLDKSQKSGLKLMEKNLERMVKTFNIEKMNFPVRKKDIKRFVSKNSHLDLNINVLFLTDNKVYPHMTGVGGGSRTVNLLMIPLSSKNTLNDVESEVGDAEFLFHFLAINNLDRFLSKSYKKCGKKVAYEKKFYCVNCLNSFSRKLSRDEHLKACSRRQGIIEKVPDKDHNKIAFSRYQNTFKQDLIGYLDFECELVKTEDKCAACKTIRCKCDSSYTRKEHIQNPICFSFLIINQQGEVLHEDTYAGSNAGEKFLIDLLELESSWIKPYLNTYNPMKELDRTQQAEYDNSLTCYMCSGFFTKDDGKVRDHDHYSGEFLGPSHRSCNLKRRRQRHLKIFLHNGSAYDFHFIIKALVKMGTQIKNMYVLPFNMERFRMIKFNSFMFLDSIAFLQAGLSTLADDLRISGHDYPIVRQTDLVLTDGKFDSEKFDMILQKGFFCYDYCSSLEKMYETQSLPPRQAFYSSIQETSISEQNYKFAKKVWRKFNVGNLTEYAMLYCRIDTLLLAEVFEKFRDTMMDFSELDPAHYVSLPGFGWDTMLKTTGCVIGLPTDIDQVHFIENSIRGGLSFINTRHKKADVNEKASIRYFDANNLYGLSQVGLLPYDNYRWLEPSEIAEFVPLKTKTSGRLGYILEVDLTYPEHLHYDHNDYPLAPEQQKLFYEDLSPYSKNCYFDSTNSKTYSSTKLMSTLNDKKKYVVHLKNLKLYLNLGMQCKKIYRVLEFEQERFIKPFILKCTEERKKASSDFDKNLFKKISNSCYGKTIENVRDYMKIKIHTSRAGFLRATATNSYQNFSIIADDVVTTSHSADEIVHNKPYAAGFTILEYSKHFMFDFYYNKLMKLCGRDSVELCMTDTDSFIFHTTDNRQMESRIAKFMDYSNYPESHRLHDKTNKAQLGFFKDEISPSLYIREFIGLRSKCYALKLKGKKTDELVYKKTCKGLGRVCIKNRLKFSEYKKALFNKEDVRHYFTGILSTKHTIHTVVRKKKALSCFDSKRYIYPCGLHSSPFGSILIRKNKGRCFRCEY